MAARISVVIPSACHERGQGLLRRILELLDCPQLTEHQVVVAHESCSTRSDERFRAQLDSRAQAGALHYVWSCCEGSELRLGELRNRGARAAEGDYLLFLDADLAIFPGFFDALLRRLESQDPPEFVIVPCLYATEIGTQRLSTGCVFDRERAHASYFDHHRDRIAFLATNTSTVLVKRETFEALGGFNREFLGHGLEDFDLLLRLALSRTSLAVPADILDDCRSEAPAFARGFRSYLNLLSLPVFLGGLSTLHRTYYQHRASNAAILSRSVGALVKRPGLEERRRECRRYLRHDGTYDSLRIVQALVEESGRAVGDCSALFDNLPQHIFHTDRTLRRIKKTVRSWHARLSPRWA